MNHHSVAELIPPDEAFLGGRVLPSGFYQMLSAPAPLAGCEFPFGFNDWPRLKNLGFHHVIPGTSEFKFQKEIEVTAGSNNFDVTATDIHGNKRVSLYAVSVDPKSKTYEYDANGNMTFEKGLFEQVIRSFEWDSADRLVAVTSGLNRIEWVYNGIGQKVLESRNGSPFRRLQWDGANLLLERGVDGTPNKKFYRSGESHKTGTYWTDFFYTRDHLGSIWQITNTDGNTKVRYEYDAYGNRTELPWSDRVCRRL